MSHRTSKMLAGAGAIFAAALVAAGALAGFLASSGRAQRSGRAQLVALAAPVEVRFDRWGVPAIAARSTADAMAALGWLHANDRLFQMELTRRAAAGRLAELFGERAVGHDRRMRRLGFPRAARDLTAGLAPETRALLEAYAAGVNAWLAARGSDLPPELRLLRHRPEPWRPEDSIGVVFVMARTLSPVVDPPEYELFELLRAFGPERARELATDPEATIFDEIAELARTTAARPEPVGSHAEGGGVGSNNWAVAATRSAAGGGALLANDPHLGLGLPNVWYPARIAAPDYDAAGMTLAGAPAVVLGRGPRLAWACTNLYIDDVDVYFERLDESGTRVARGDGWREIERWTETIRIDGGAEVAVEVKRTDRGAFLDADPERGLPPRSVAWTGYGPGDPLAAFVALARARSVDEVPARVAGYGFPAQNLVAADAAGRILWTPLGRGPRRFGWDGRFPAPGWRIDVGWDGIYGAELNPVLVDPPAGVVATANSLLPVERPPWFSQDFDTPFRLDRILELLATRDRWPLEELAALQLDVGSHWARRLVFEFAGASRLHEASSASRLDEEAAGASRLDGDAGRAVAALAGWDGEMAERGPAALFALVERELQRAIFEDEAEQAGLGRFGTRKRLLALLDGRLAASWYDDVKTPEVEDRDATIAAGLAAAWRAGSRRWGDDVARWSYGELHTLTLNHALDGLPLVGRWWRRGPYPVPGSATTIAAFGGPWRGDALDVAYGPSMRFVTDAADPSRILVALPGGQSGHPADRHYDDRIAGYLAGRFHELAWSEAAIEAATVSRLELVPGR